MFFKGNEYFFPLFEWVSCFVTWQNSGYEWYLYLEDKKLSLGKSCQALIPEELYYSCVFMSYFTHHRPRQTLVQICSRRTVMISTFRSQGEAACNLLLPNIPKYLVSWFEIFFPFWHKFSQTHTHTYCLQLSNSVTLMHTVNAAGMCDVGSMWLRLVLLHSTANPPWFRICFYSPLCQGLYSKLTRKNLSLTCHVFPGGGMWSNLPEWAESLLTSECWLVCVIVCPVVRQVI